MPDAAPPPTMAGLILIALMAACRATPAEPPAPAPTPPPAAAPSEPAADAVATCGRPPLPRCPLQQWMHSNLSPLLAKDPREVRKFVRPLQALAKAGPPGYDDWYALAMETSKVAAAGDTEGVREACNACHDTHRSKYRSELRAQPLPAVLRGAD